VGAIVSTQAIQAIIRRRHIHRRRRSV
jgi:hypothetical protein